MQNQPGKHPSPTLRKIRYIKIEYVLYIWYNVPQQIRPSSLGQQGEKSYINIKNCFQ
jgi:hypothetical protein